MRLYMFNMKFHQEYNEIYGMWSLQGSDISIDTDLKLSHSAH
jgi:hypothetical protein